MDAIKVELRKSPKDIIESSYYNIVRRRLLNNSVDFKNSKEFKNYLEKGVQKKLIKFQNLDKSLNEVIPLGVISSLKVYIYNKNHDISMGIKELLNDEKVQLKLQNVF